MLRIYVKSPPAPVEIVPDYYPVKYGLLYNYYAIADARGFCAVGWDIPTDLEIQTLELYLGMSPSVVNNMNSRGVNEGGKLKEVGFEHWESPNTGALDSFGFNLRGAGVRINNGVFDHLTNFTWVNTKSAVSTLTYIRSINNASAQINRSYAIKSDGTSIRLVCPATAAEQLLADGTACAPYVGNDGKIYPTVKIGTQVWTAANSCETKFRNGDYIPGFDGGVYTPISNATWAAATTAMCCVYDDDLTNM